MTPEQKAAMDQAEALAEAEAAAAAEANAAAGVTEGVESGNELLGAGKSFVRGIGRGVASLPDAPAAIYTGIKNLPKRAYNTFGGERPVESDDHGDAPMPVAVQPTGPAKPLAYPQAPSEDQQLPLDTAPKTPISSAYDASFPIDENHPYADMFGTVAGPAIVEAAATGGGSLLTIPGALNATRRAGATTTGTLIGGGLGGEVDKALGGTGDIGSVVGGGVGGGVAPGLFTQAGWKGLSTMFTDADSPTRLRNYDVMRGNLPDEVSLGLAGNKRAGQVEDATAGIPFAGNRAYTTRKAQHEQMDAAGKAVAEIPRGGPSQGNISPSATGQNVMNTAELASKKAQAAQQNVFEPMKQQIGPDTVLPSKALSDQIDKLSRGGTVGADKPTYDYFGKLIEANAREPLASGAPKVMDPTLEASLQAQLARAQANLAAAKPGSPLHTASTQSVMDLTDAINANRNPTYENLIKLRTKSANPLDSAENFDYAAHLNVKTALTEAQKELAASKGVSPAEFDQVNAEYGRLAAQRDFFDKLRDKTGQGEAYSAMMSGNARHNADQVAALYEHAPQQTSQLFADELEKQIRGSRNAGGPPVAEGLAPQTKTAPKWFSDLPDQTREIMSGAPASDWEDTRLNALLQTMEADARRPSRTIPGAGGNTLGLASIFKQATIPTAAMTYLTGPVGGAITAPVAALGPTLKARAAARYLTSPWATRRTVAARDQPWFNDTNTLARIMASAYGANESGAH